MKRTLITAATALAALTSCAAPAHAAGEQIRLTNREAGRWCGTARLTSRSTYQMTASAIQTEGTYAACAISVNNKTTATDYATGRYAVAMCAS